jgi:hypothetical protein
MSTLPSYHPQALQQRLITQIANALKAKDLTPQQHLSLLKLASAQPGHGLRAGRLVESANPMACSDAILITGATTTVYLSTGLYGLERFDSRHAVTEELKKRETLNNPANLEFVLLEEPLFKAQSQALLEQRHEALQQLAKRLQRLPSLDDALNSMFLQKLGLLEEAALDGAATLYLHITLEQKVTRALTLAEALREHFCGVPLPAGHVRTWLNPQGQPFTAEAAQPYERALVSPSDDLRDTFKTLLSRYWADPAQCPNAAQTLAHGFELQVQRQYHAGYLTTEQVQWLRTVLHSTDHPGAPRMSRLRIVDPIQGALEIAGLCVLQDSAEAYPYLYSPTSGLHAYNELATLKDHLLNEADRMTLASGLSREDRVTLLSMDAPKITLKPVKAPLLGERAASIVALQARQLEQALAQARRWQASAPLAVDEALDIRALLDPRLLNLPGAGRWPDARADLSDAVPDPSLGLAHDQWNQRIKALAQRRESFSQHQPQLAGCAREVLDGWLAIMTWPCLAADTLMLRWTEANRPTEGGAEVADAPANRTAALGELLLGRVTGHTPFSASDQQARLFVADGQTRPRAERQLPADMVDALLGHAASGLQWHYLDALQQYLERPQRQGREQQRPGQVLHQLLEQALRIEIAVKRTLFAAHAGALDGLQHALDLPIAILRGQHGVQVHGLMLGLRDDEPGAEMAASFIVHATDAPQGPIVMWSPLSGLKRFASLAQLREVMAFDMTLPAGRTPWLNMLAAPARLRLRTAWARNPALTPLLTTQRVTGDVVEHQLRSRQAWIRGNAQQAWQLAVDGGFEPELFAASLAHSLIADDIDMDLRALEDALDTLELLKRLPLWARNASVSELQGYVDRLRYCTETLQSRHNYLFDIPDLHTFTADQLKHAMQVKGVSVPEPSEVRVTLREYVTDLPHPGDLPNMHAAATKTRTLSLVDCALRHYDIKESLQERTFLADGRPAPAWLTGSYVTRLIYQQDLGGAYQHILAELFSPTDPDYSVRQTWYIHSLTVQLLEITFRYYLQKRLKTTALRYLLSMIESAAAPTRRTLHGTPISLRPVRLVAQPGMKADTVTGMYLVGPDDVNEGPVVLYAPYADILTLKQYDNQAAFLSDAQSDPALAALIVSRVADDARSRYAQGGLLEAHVPFNTESSFDAVPTPPPLTLDATPATGSAPQFLFEDNLRLLQMMARRQTVTNAQADWQAFTYIASLGLEQGQMFLPGEMALLVGAWQSQSLLSSGVQAARQRQWSEAVAEFVAAFANMVQHRRETTSTLPTQAMRPVFQEAPADGTPLPALPALTSGWPTPALPSELRTRLYALQARDVQIDDLLKDPLTHLYAAEGDPAQYAAVMGRVFQVEQDHGEVYIVCDGERGPRLTLTARQDWQVELPSGLRGGGGGASRAYNRVIIDHSLQKFFTVYAEGMPAIRAASFRRAQEIVSAHTLAADYMRVCLQNLNTTRPELPLPPRSLQIIRDFLSVSTVTPQVLMKIRARARDLFTYLLQPAMNPVSSMNYVMGQTHNPDSAIIAFVFSTELRDRVYLNERFFNTPAVYFRHVALTTRGFDVTAHYQAATLLHELSHLFTDTTDIAYLEANAPFLDLYDSNPAAKAFRDQVEEAQQQALSRLTPRAQLFKLETNTGLVDLRGRARAQVLELTDTDTLDDARNEFYLSTAKRVEVMINNADTLTLLMTLLGRELHPA